MSVLAEVELFVNRLSDEPIEDEVALVDTTLITACFKARYHQDLIVSVFAEMWKAATDEERERFGYGVRKKGETFEITTATGKVVGVFSESKGAAHLLWIRSMDDLMALDMLSEEVEGER